MDEVRSYTNGQRGSHGAVAPNGRGSGDFVNALQDAVRDNPISAALIGMGVLWMFMGGSNTSLFGGGGRKSIFRSVGQSADVVGGVVSDAATRVGSSVGRVADAAAETVSHMSVAGSDKRQLRWQTALRVLPGRQQTRSHPPRRAQPMTCRKRGRSGATQFSKILRSSLSGTPCCWEQSD